MTWHIMYYIEWSTNHTIRILQKNKTNWSRSRQAWIKMNEMNNNEKNYEAANSTKTLLTVWHEISCIILNGVLIIYNFGLWRPSCGFKFALWSKLGKGQNEVVAASSVSIPFQIEREFFWHGSLLICQLLDINGIGESIFPLSHSAV